MDNEQLDAYKRGILCAKQLGYFISEKQVKALEFKQFNNLQLYNVENSIGPRKTATKIKFDQMVKRKIGDKQI